MVEITAPKSAEASTPPAEPAASSQTESEAIFSPNNLRVNKRHTRILGTLNKRANQEFIDM